MNRIKYLSKRVKLISIVMVLLVVLLAGAAPAWVAETKGKDAVARVVDIGMAKDPIALLSALEERRMNLEDREKLLEIREVDLKRLEEKLAKRIVALEQLREAIRADLALEKEMDGDNIKKLAKIFSSMKPKAAAASLMAMDQETAVKTVKALPEKVAAKILSKMNVAEAVQISEALGLPIAQKRGQAQP